jgi:hypothetical protein
MIRTGETVVVPIGFRLIRCGINEPVTKTVSSLDCFFCSEACSAGLPANAALASKPAAMMLATPEESSVLISNLTTDTSPRKLDNGILISAGRVKSKFRLQFSPKPINEPVLLD